MTRQTLGLILAGAAVAVTGVTFVVARSSRHQALLAPLPAVSLDQFRPSGRKLVAEMIENVKKEPLRADRWGELGYALAGNGAPAEAAVAFARAEELDDDNHRWPHLYAMATIKTNRAAAIAALQRSLEDRPLVTATMGELAESYLEDGADKEADALLRPHITEKTEDQRLVLAMARIEANAGAIDKAIALAERAAAMPPRRRQIHQLLAQLYQRKGDEANARKNARLLELLPKAENEPPWPDPIWAQAQRYSRSVDAVSIQARTLTFQRQPDEAIRLIEELHPEERSTPACLAALAIAKAHRGEFAAADEALNASNVSDDPNILFARGINALLQKRFAEAADFFLKSTVVRADGIGARAIDGAHFNRAICLLELKKDDDATAALERTLELNPGNFEAILRLADIRLKKNRKDDAAKLLADAALLDPDNDRVKALQQRIAN